MVALIEASGRSVTFDALRTMSSTNVTAWSRKGIGPGDRVLVAMGVGADLYAALDAIWRLGATAVLPEPALGLAGIRHACRICDISAICTSGLYGTIRFLVPRLLLKPALTPTRPGAAIGTDLSSPDGIALISFTSGTSGRPKAIARTHRFLMAQRAAIAPLLQGDAHHRDLVAFPVFVLLNLADGRCSILPNWQMQRPDKLTRDALIRRIAQTGATRLLIPPRIAETLTTGGIPPTIETIFTGGGPIYPDTIRRLQAAPHAPRIVCVYGSTEAEPIAHLDCGDITEDDFTAMENGAGLLAGYPVPAIDLQIEDHEIRVTGPHVNEGYLDPRDDDDNKIRSDGRTWHRTGDAGRCDDAGRLWLLGRRNAILKHDGELVSPFAIEAAARSWAGIRRAALLPDPLTLFVEAEEDAMPDWRKRAAALKIDRIVRVKAIPMDRRHRSKVDLTALRRAIGE